LFVELMDRLRTRQPNYHARLHRGSPAAFRTRLARALAAGSASPALYNDDVIVPVLRARGLSEEDALGYTTVGCVEPVATGKSFLSTDAALLNLPGCLELALNRGCRFVGTKVEGARTGPAQACGSADELFALFAEQLEHVCARLMDDLQQVERANARWHPTPLTSMLLQGCVQSGRDASAGGALYNGSGIQGVGVVDVGDSFAALAQVVFREKLASMAEVVDACRTDFRGADALRARLRGAPKYGSDDRTADGWVARVMELLAATLGKRRNTRGGDYAAGYYAVTAHVAFGEVTGALPSGRQAGRPFASGISPESGLDRRGPTAALLSAASLPARAAMNGVNFNLQLPPWTVSDAHGPAWLGGLIAGGFAAGCMQMQVNVLDPKMLREARDEPGRYPGLLVRVSGYSAYFDDLSPQVKQEIIDRMVKTATAP
jgi:pyruvate-formate lyase